MDKKRPQLSNDDLARLRWLLGSVLGLLSVMTVFFMDIDAWLMMPAVALAAVAAIVWPTWPARVPRLVHRLAFPFIVLFFVYDLVTSREPLPALIHLDLLLILYRLITYRQRRDDLQLVVLGLFLIIVAGVITVSMSFAVQIIAFTGVSLVMLLAVTLEFADGRSNAVIQPGTRPAWTRGPWRDHFRRLRASTDLRIAALGAVAFTAVVVISGLLFLAIPRFEIQSSMFIDRLIQRTTRTGFSDNIQFGEVTSITSDNGLALSVDVTDPSAMPLQPYWRMVVLDEYTGNGFRISDDFRRQLNGRRPPRSRLTGAPGFTRGSPTWTFFMEPGISRYLPLLGSFYDLRFTEPQTFTYQPNLRVVALQRDPPKMFAYRTWSMDTSDRVKDASFALDRRANEVDGPTFLELSSLNETDRIRLDRLRETVALDAAPGTRGFATAAVDWLEGMHPYSLNSSLPGQDDGSDRLLRWLDSETAGHCEFFAGSMVLLARAAGYPARLVTGFKGGSWNGYSGSFTVRNANAHAWCEIFDDESGSWIRVDPTPGSTALAAMEDDPAARAAALARIQDNSWQARMESLRVFWYRRIVNFDLDTQKELTSAAKEFFSEATKMVIAWSDHKIDALRDWIKRPWNTGRTTDLLGAGLVITGVVIVWRRFGRRWWLAFRRISSRPDQDPVRREAGRWLQRGHKKSDFAWPDDVREALLRLRFGDADTWPDPLQVFSAAKTALRTK